MDSLECTSPWRGSALIWTPKRWVSGEWPLGKLRWGPGRIEIQALGTKLAFQPDQVVEMRFYQWPVPTLKVVIKDGDSHALVTFSAFRGNRIRAIVNACGFQITKNCRWNIGGDESKDMKTYGLYDGP